MDTDIRDEIDRSFGEGPPLDDRGPLIARGHAAVRRRRLAEGGSVLLVAAGVTVIAVLSTSGTTKSASPGPAGAPSSAVAPTPQPTPVVPDSEPDVVTVENDRLPRGIAVVLEPDGTVSVRPGVEVTQTIANPYHRKAPAISIALTYTWRGTTYWYSSFVDENRGSSTSSQPVMTSMSFREWVHEQRPIRAGSNGPGSTDPGDWPGNPDLDLVGFIGGSQRLQPSAGVTIVEQRAHPDVPDSFATADDRSAVAEVRLEGERYYVLARRTADGSPPDYIAVTAKDGGATLDDFLELARERYAEGGGGLL